MQRLIKRKVLNHITETAQRKAHSLDALALRAVHLYREGGHAHISQALDAVANDYNVNRDDLSRAYNTALAAGVYL